MITLNFYTIKEKLPGPDAEVIWLNTLSSFNSIGFHLRQSRAEYYWDNNDGTSILFDIDHPDPPNESPGEIWTRRLSFGGYDVNENTPWMPVKEYWKAFGLNLD